MATITVRNVPDSVYRDLQKESKKENRSLNGQVLQIFKDYINQKKPTETILKDIEALHEKVGSINFSQEEIKTIIEEGRP
ncbi:hypothetical protein KKA14_20960 [bacterium]|nr:hypothetical protein [bacterium]